MDIFDHDLETVEAPRFGDLHFADKINREIFVHDAVGGGKKREHMFDEMLFVVIQPFPIFGIVRKVDLLGRPEARFGLFIHFPYFVMLDREQNEAVFVLF